MWFGFQDFKFLDLSDFVEVKIYQHPLHSLTNLKIREIEETVLSLKNRVDV